MRGVAKLSPRLAEHIESVDAGSVIDVIVELNALDVPKSGSREERAANLKAGFERELRPIANAVAAAGGHVVDSAWINQTMRGRIPAGQVSRLAEEEMVSRIDLPEMLRADA